MLMALPHYDRVEFLHEQMRPLITAEHLESFERSYFVSEYWLERKNGKYTCKPGFTPFGLGAHVTSLYCLLGSYEADVYVELVDALVHNLAEFQRLGVAPARLELPSELLRLVDETSFMGVQVFHTGSFPAGAIYSEPEFGRYLVFPALEEEHGKR